MQARCLLADGDHAIAIHGCVLAVYNLGENSLVSAIAANVSFSKARLSVILGTAMYANDPRLWPCRLPQESNQVKLDLRTAIYFSPDRQLAAYEVGSFPHAGQAVVPLTAVSTQHV